MSPTAPCYFNIAEASLPGEKEGQEVTFFSLGINNQSFGIFKKEEKAAAALEALESFLLDKNTRFQVPADK